MREQGLTPCDVHGKNVMMEKGRGYVVDVSDFLKQKKIVSGGIRKGIFHLLFSFHL